MKGRRMKNQFRLSVGFIVVVPFALATHLLSLFLGKAKAVEKIGPLVTMFAKSIQQFFPPQIKNASEFDIFRTKIGENQKFWSLIYDYPIDYPDKNSVRLEIRNCPFAEATEILKISELGPYMCQGDREVAKDNAEKWNFERHFQIGTGDLICDFKYTRIQK
jgi:hypothetical protein